eukprot:g581.t1
MLGGPIGAVVGSQVASKIGPVLNNALDAMEVDEGDEEKEEVSKKEAKETKDVQAGQEPPTWLWIYHGPMDMLLTWTNCSDRIYVLRSSDNPCEL